MTEFSENKSALGHARKAAHKSQVELAELIGVEQSTISKWERSHVPPLRVLELCRVLGCHPHELRPDLYHAPSAVENV